MNEKQVCKKRKCISFEVKIEIIKNHIGQKITNLENKFNFNGLKLNSILI